MAGQSRAVIHPLVELRCCDLVEMVTDYLESALPPGDRRRLERHLKCCEGCSVYLAHMRETVRLVGLSASVWE
jgi:anti-sigma factor RsiW